MPSIIVYNIAFEKFLTQVVISTCKKLCICETETVHCCTVTPSPLPPQTPQTQRHADPEDLRDWDPVHLRALHGFCQNAKTTKTSC